MKQLASLLGAAACGVVVALLAFLMAAGGHGWAAPVVSATAILTAPAGAVAWLARRRAIAMVVVAISIVIDIAFVVLAAREGLGSAASTFEHLAPVVIVWALLWIAVQVPPVLVVFRNEMGR